MKKRIKINGFIIGITVLIACIFPHVFLREAGSAYGYRIVEIVGVSLILFGQLLRVSSRGYKSEHSSNSHRLVQDGPYLLVRNPMYLGIIAIGVGVIVTLFHWWVFLVFVVFFIVRYIFLIKQEESRLLAAFPKEYPEYMRRVPRLHPSLRTVFSTEISHYLPLRLTWIKRELPSIVWVLVAVCGIHYAVNFKTAGTLEYGRDILAIILLVGCFILLVRYLAACTKRVK